MKIEETFEKEITNYLSSKYSVNKKDLVNNIELYGQYIDSYELLIFLEELQAIADNHNLKVDIDALLNSEKINLSQVLKYTISKC